MAAICVSQIRAVGPAAVASKRRVALRSRAAVKSRAVATAATETDEVQKVLKEGNVTVEYQRRKAKEMVQFFKQQDYDQAVEESQVFGFTAKNEINNGRWTMFGLLVGMLTEYATGVDFIDQIKLTISVLGIADIYD
ncbi:high light induced protein like, chloroplast precursor [Micromonas pusilla CCMP1545]|uniref:High light induced protein like, chloroplast n=2 Tax=Micromonas pusilla TaxID=38833 RepID=C1MMW8_MICPC|nr:high light induced protein like, chloroplast precursor [Micromonas pusilla CCMP1545]EEH59125.1 high light induced protein like, chloroplast precursor [Micromonas pusilla CCMP1545]|eukprot:XP_003057480.1 high light induced protein like, chloroplast precursor [Micromonas pusilla CCMP1545]